MHIDISGWFADLKETREQHGSYLMLLNMVQDIYNSFFFSVTSRYPLGTNIFNRDWDLLIVLDACRVDALKEVAPEYEFITNVGSIWSVGSHSNEWLAKTFTTDHLSEIQETVHVTANPSAVHVLRDQISLAEEYSIPVEFGRWNVVSDIDFKKFQFVSDHVSHRRNLQCNPEYLTDYAIHAGRQLDFSRMVVHYMQPHEPHAAQAFKNERPPTEVESNPWQSLSTGDVSRKKVWDNYLNNLRHVLNSVEQLLDNFEADTVVITADHGELFGEWGAYSHPSGFPHPDLKRVPWATTTARDNKTCMPDVKNMNTDSRDYIEDQLRALGYTE